MADNNHLKTVEETITQDPNGNTKTITTTTVQQREDGTVHTSERKLSITQTNEINIKEATTTGVKTVEGGSAYINALKLKGEVAIIQGENHLINILNLKSLEVILKLMGTNLEDFYYDISFGIYTSEEIVEFRRSLSSSIKRDEYVKYYDYIIPPEDKVQLPVFFAEDIFEKVQKSLEVMRAEKERLKSEGELREKQELEDQKKKEEEEQERLRLEKEEEERKKKEEEEQERLRLEKEEEERKQKEEEEQERLRLEEEEKKKKELEEQERLKKEEEERLKKDEEEKRKKEEEELQQKEEEEKKKKEEEEEEERKKELEEKRQKEEEEKKKKEEEERLQREQEEAIRKEEEEKRKIELEEKKKKDEEERKKKEEEKKKKKEEEDKKKKEEAEKKKKEMEEKKQEELEKKKKKEEEIKKKKEEDEKKKKELEEKKKKEKEENLKKKKEEEEKKKKELEDKKKEENEKKKKMLEEKKKKDDEAKKKKEEEAKKKKEEESKKKEEMKKKKEEEKKKKEQEDKKKKEEEAKKKKELEEKKKKEDDAKKKKEEEAKKKKEEEAKKKKELEEEDKKKKLEAQKKKKEEDKKRKEKKEKEEEEKRKKEEEKKKKEEELRKKLEEKKKEKEKEKKEKAKAKAKSKSKDKVKEKEKDMILKEKLEVKEETVEKEPENELAKEKEENKEERDTENDNNKNEENINENANEKEEQIISLNNNEKEEQKDNENENEEGKDNEKENESEKVVEVGKESEKENKKNIPEKKVLRAKKQNIPKPAKKQLTDYPLKKKSDIEKMIGNAEEKPEEGDEQKPKKKKKVVKKTITKMVKKKVHKDSQEYQNYLREKERGFKAFGHSSLGGGFGVSDKGSNSYIANVSNPIAPKCECINCHADISKGNSGKKLCNNCLNTLRKSNSNENNNDKDLKTLKYYQDDIDDKFDTIGTKEFYQLNKDRYLNELWKEENEKLEKIDEDFNKNKKKVLPNDSELKKDNKEELKKGRIDNKLFLFNKPFCSKCGKLQDKNTTKGVYFCSNCEGLICGNCSKGHYKDNPDHNCNHVSIEDKQYWKVPQKIRCSNCNELKPISVIYNCNVCEGKPICKTCSQDHNINNPTHMLKLFGKLDYNSEKSPDNVEKDLIRCPNCGIKDNNLVSCPTCNVVFCVKCSNEHYSFNPSHSKPAEINLKSDKKGQKLPDDDKLFKKKSGEPYQKIDKNIPRSNINFTTNCKMCNNLLPLGDEECVLVNCIDCLGNLCDECCDNHEKKYPQHELNPIRAVFMENANVFSDSIPKLKCNKCRKNINDFENIYLCDDCGNELCSDCGEKHSPEHDLLLTKRILINDNKGNIVCRQCGIDLGKNANAFRKCDKCKIDLCDACGDSHIEKYPNHNIFYTLLKDNLKQTNDENNKDLLNKLKIPNDKCINCNKKVKIENNSINYCNNCNGNLCDNCNYSHKKDNPDHIKVTPKVVLLNKDRINLNKLPIHRCIACDNKLNSNLNEPFINCEKCHGNICDDCNKSHLQEFPNHKLKLIKYIINDDEERKYLYDNLPVIYECISCGEKAPLNSDINYCKNCLGNICENCLKQHNKNNKNHNLRKLNQIIIEKSKDNTFNQPNIFCNSCGRDLNKNINDYINNCPICKSILCDECISKHNEDYPNHNLTYDKYIFFNIEEPEDNSDNKNNKNLLKSIPNEKCSICKKTIKFGKNNQLTHCNKCKGNLCDNCEENHDTLFPGHDYIIKKYIISRYPYNKENINKDDNYCFVCQNNIPIINKGKIFYCLHCSEKICDSCGNNHTITNPEHRLYDFKTLRIENSKDELKGIKLKDKCGECGNKINPNNTYYCYECSNNLCNKCVHLHLKNRPEHHNNLVFISKVEGINPLKCNVCGRISRNKNGENDNNKCENCQVNLCEECSNTHLKKYPNHTIKNTSLSFKIDRKDKNKNAQNLMITQNGKCLKCNQKVNLKDRDFITQCNNCKGNLCDTCAIQHSKEYPEHNVITPNVIILNNKININKLPIYKCISCDKNLKGDLNELYNNCNKCHGNVCDECSINHSDKFPDHLLKIKKYLIIDEAPEKNLLFENVPINFICASCKERIPLNSKISYCDDCKDIFCENCLKSHDKARPLNIILLGGDKGKFFKKPEIACNECQNNLSKNINDYIYNCPKCQNILCDNCVEKHTNENPNHNLSYNKYIFYEIEDENPNDQNKFNSLKNNPCPICQKVIKPINNNQVLYCYKCKDVLCDDCEKNHRTQFPGHDFIIKKHILLNNYDNILEINDKNRNKINLDIDNDRKNWKENENIKENENEFKLKETDIRKPRIKQRSKKISLKPEIELNNNLNELDNLNKEKEKEKEKEEEIEKEKDKEEDKDNLFKNKPSKNLNLKISKKVNMNTPHEINCMSCHSKIKDFKECTACYGYLCSNCNNSNNEENENVFEVVHPEKNSSFNTSHVNCVICNEYLLKDLNKPINHCTICDGNLCSNCSVNHLSKNPSHNLLLTKFILTEYISYNDKNMPNQNLCLGCNKNLDKSNSKLIHYCNQCRRNICLECAEKHNNEYPEHILILSKNLRRNNAIFGQKEKVNCTCSLCNASHDEVQNKKFYFCRECNKNICETCKNKHEEEFYSHIVTNPHAYEGHKN